MLPIAFSGGPLDRADAVRSDPQALAALRDDGARVLRLDGLYPVLDDESRLVWEPLGAADERELVFLGLLAGIAHFAPVAPDLMGSVAPASVALRQTLALLGHDDLALYGGARSLVDWHSRHRFCARCGRPTQPAKGGWQRNCTGCGAEHYPRVDPVAIMIVEQDDRLLLGRQPRFAPRLWSALAGFVEPGEAIEEAVAREVFEEAGVRVRDVTYVTSQPWPFPSSLMIGCHALADDPSIRIDPAELEDARWFTRAEIEAALAGGAGEAAIMLPPAQAIAHQLVRWWIGRARDGGRGRG